MSISFRKWLETHTSRDDNVGRFARDVVRDTSAPEGASVHIWQAHLKDRGAGPGALQAFRDAWKEFERRR
jgi:uncharacterized protein YozE (UPF0346 family)